MKKKTKIREAVDASVAKGWRMQKVLVGGHMVGGFFSYWNPATYDTRTVYKLEDVFKLNSEGFTLTDDHGNLALNILLVL